MLQLGSRTFEVDGVTVMCDHADAAQFYYLASRVEIDRRPDGTPAFTLMKWRGEVPGAVNGGGFLTFQTVVKVPEATLAKIKGRLSSLVPPGVTPVLAAAPIDRATVRCIALNLEGGGGTSATAPPGAFTPVTSILGATKPSGSGEQTAMFSLTLDQAGATILEQVFEQGGMPVGVVYDEEYSALTPDLKVEIKADFNRIYTHFSAGVEAQIYWVRAGIDAAFERLRQEGAIEVKVIDFDNAPDRAEREKWALDFFKQELLAKWFEPSLDLGQAKGTAQPEGLDSVLDRLKKAAVGALEATVGGGKTGGKDGAASGGGKGTEGKGTETKGDAGPSDTPGSKEPGADAPNVTPPPKSKADAARVAAAKPSSPPLEAKLELPGATLVIDNTFPASLPDGRGLRLVDGSGGTITLEVEAAAGATVRVDGAVQPVDPSGRFTLDVAANASHQVSVEWPVSAPVDETFPLFFSFDQPREPGFSATPSNPVFRAYLQNTPAPADPRFSQSIAAGRTPPPSGADALRDWLDRRLVAPKQVQLAAHASFEGDTSSATTVLNQRLSERRLAVARGIIANKATIGSAEAFGFNRAKAREQLGREDDRVVEIIGKVAGKDPASSLRATVSRGAAAATDVTPPEAETPVSDGTREEPTDTSGTDAGADPPKDPGATGGKNESSTTTPGSTTPGTTTSTPTTGATGGGTPSLVSFRLKFLRQEERKQLTLVYDRKKAVKRTHAPQGFIGALLDELPDKSKHFIRIAGDDPFFRKLAVDIATPADFGKIGLFSSEVAIDYGDAAAPQDHRHEEFRLTAVDRGPKRFETFLNSRADVSFRVLEQHHFDANSGWVGEKLSYELPARLTTDRTLNVDPGNGLGFLELEVFPNRIDAGIIERIDVALDYDDGASFRRRDTLRVQPGSPPQRWQLRLTRGDRREWSATLTHHLKNGDRRTSPPIRSDAAFLPVDDPFTGSLELLFVPLFAPGSVRRAFIDVEYTDDANQYRRVERFEIPGTAVDPVPLRLALLDPSRRTFRHRVTLQTEQGGLIQKAPVDGEETLIGVGLD